MICVHVDAMTEDDKDLSYAIMDVASPDDVPLAVWRAACLLDRGGRITVNIDEKDFREYARLADVPRPVLRVYWRVTTLHRNRDGYRGDTHEFTTLRRADAWARARSTRLAWPQATVTVTRVTVRPKRAR